MDLAIIYGPSADLHLTVQSLGRDNIVAVGPRGCGLAQQEEVDIGWLLRQRLVLPSHSHGLRALIEHAAAKKKIKLDVQLEADSFRVLTSLVEEGLGYALLPPSSVRSEVADGRLETAPIPSRRPRELTFRFADRPSRLDGDHADHDLLREEVAACRKEGLWDIRARLSVPVASS